MYAHLDMTLSIMEHVHFAGHTHHRNVHAAQLQVSLKVGQRHAVVESLSRMKYDGVQRFNFFQHRELVNDHAHA